MSSQDQIPAPSLSEILELEERVWQALVTGDAALDHSMLSEDFLGVYPSGFADRSAHTSQLEQGPSMQAYRLGDAQLRRISPEAVLLSYRAEYQAAGTEVWDAMLISSLWEQRDDGWINTFSQDTPLNADGL